MRMSRLRRACCRTLAALRCYSSIGRSCAALRNQLKNRSIRNPNRSGNHPPRWPQPRALAQLPPASEIGRPHLTSPSAVRREVPFPAGLCYVYLTCGFSQAGKFRLSPLPHRVHRSHPRLENGPSAARPFRLSLDYDRKRLTDPSVPRPVPCAPKQNACARLLHTSTAEILQRARIATHASVTSRIPSRTCCPGLWGRGFSCSFARPLIPAQPLALTPSPANCAAPS